MIGQSGEYPVTVHTVDGRAIGQITSLDTANITWGRELNEVSRCDAVFAADADVIDRLTPWHHWITAWGDTAPVWSGPVRKVTIGDHEARVEARDVAAFMSRTRVPLTRAWRSREPAAIADLMWRSMLELHQVPIDPLVLPSVGGEVFDLSVTAETQMLSQASDELVKLGLRWTVVAGRPVLGVQPDDPVAALHDCDFMESTQVVRDGSRAANDVRVQGQNAARTYTADMAGLRLQALVSIDDLFGVSNIERAARQYARGVAAIREQIVVPSSATLHPDAEVTVDDLVPGAHFMVHSRGLSEVMMLTQMEVSASGGAHDVSVTLESIEEPTELELLAEGGAR